MELSFSWSSFILVIIIFLIDLTASNPSIHSNQPQRFIRSASSTDFELQEPINSPSIGYCQYLLKELDDWHSRKISLNLDVAMKELELCIEFISEKQAIEPDADGLLVQMQSRLLDYHEFLGQYSGQASKQPKRVTTNPPSSAEEEQSESELQAHSSSQNPPQRRPAPAQSNRRWRQPSQYLLGWLQLSVEQMLQDDAELAAHCPELVIFVEANFAATNQFELNVEQEWNIPLESFRKRLLHCALYYQKCGNLKWKEILDRVRDQTNQRTQRQQKKEQSGQHGDDPVEPPVHEINSKRTSPPKPPGNLELQITLEHEYTPSRAWCNYLLEELDQWHKEKSDRIDLEATRKELELCIEFISLMQMAEPGDGSLVKMHSRLVAYQEEVVRQLKLKNPPPPQEDPKMDRPSRDWCRIVVAELYERFKQKTPTIERPETIINNLELCLEFYSLLEMADPNDASVAPMKTWLKYFLVRVRQQISGHF